MRIISYNVNGFRAFYNKGAYDALINQYDPDILCLQETKISKDELLGYIGGEYFVTHSQSRIGGYAGVATLIKGSLRDTFISEEVDLMEHLEADKEYCTGRIVKSGFPEFTLINTYTLNSGGKDALRKQWNEVFNNFLRNEITPVIVCGDLNVVAGPFDYWGYYEGVIDTMPGLMLYEIDDFHYKLQQFALVDSFRALHQNDRRYSWYSYRQRARQYNHGWRLDYFLVSMELMSKVKNSLVLQEFEGSDHTPIMLEI